MVDGKHALAKNLEDLMHKRGISRTKLADDLGVKYLTLSDWANGRTYPRVNAIAQLASYFNVTVSALITDHTTPTDTLQGIVSIPVIGTATAGLPILSDENIDGYIKEVKENLPAGDLFYLRIKDQSMEPTIEAGSLVLVKQQSVVENGEIAAVLVDDVVTLRRVVKTKNGIVLSPDNRVYNPVVIGPEDAHSILGKATRAIRDL